MSFEDALREVVTFIESLPSEEFSMRGTTRAAVLANTNRLEWLAEEHRKCVCQFGVDREWSLQDAVLVEPGFC